MVVMMKLKRLFVPALVLMIAWASAFAGSMEGKDPDQVGMRTLQDSNPIPQGLSPAALAVTEDGKYGYTSLEFSGFIFKVRLENLTVEAWADLSYFYPPFILHIALDASEQKLFVYADVLRKLIVLDTQTMSVIHTIDDIYLIGLTRSQYGSFLIAWTGGGTVSFVNTNTYEVTEFTDNAMRFVKIQESDYSQSKWYVASRVSGDNLTVGLYDYVAKLWDYSLSIPIHEGEDINDLEVLQQSQKAYIATRGGNYPIGETYGWLYAIDLTAMKVKTVPIDGAASCLEANANGSFLYVGTMAPIPNDNNIVVVDTGSDDVVDNIVLGRNKYGWAYTWMNRLQIDPANPHLLYATCGDANAFIKADLDNLTLIDVLVPNQESFRPQFFVKRPNQAAGYILIHQSANALEFNLDNATIESVVEFPAIRNDSGGYDVAINDAGRLFIAQGETILEVNESDMSLLGAHPLPPDISGLWSFVLSEDQTRLYSIWASPEAGGFPDTFIAINATDFHVQACLKLEGGIFNDKPYELPDGSKVYALGGLLNGEVVIQVIETSNYTIEKTITFNQSGLQGISAGPYYPFAYDADSHTLFVGATYVVLAIDTEIDVIKKVIYLEDAVKAIGLEPWQITYTCASTLLYNPQENCLYIAQLDYCFVSIYNLTIDQFLPKIIPLKGFFPTFLFANDNYSKIYCLMVRSDTVSVIDVNSKTVEKDIDLHSSLAPETKTFSVQADTKTYEVSVSSNSSISMFDFSPSSKQISFRTMGLSFAFSFPFFCNVTFPNELLWGNLTVLVGGNATVEPIRKDNGTHTSLYFTYELQGAKNVQVTGTEAVPEFPSATILTVFMALTLLATALIRKKRTRRLG